MKNSPENHRESLDRQPQASVLFASEINFPDDALGKLNEHGRITKPLEHLLEQYYPDQSEHYRDLILLTDAIIDNIEHHADGKGYIEFSREFDPIVGRDILHLVIGDFGVGIGQSMGDINKFISGDVNESHAAYFMSQIAQSGSIHLALRDNGKTHIMHAPKGFENYQWDSKENITDKGARFIATVITPDGIDKQQLIESMSWELDEKGDEQETRKKRQEISHYLSKYFKSGKDAMSYIGMQSEILKNIGDHGGGKGYVQTVTLKGSQPNTYLLHFAMGDYGAGIKATAGSHENFFTEGFTTGNAEQKNHGRGGARIPKHAADLGIHMDLYDNGEKLSLHQVPQVAYNERSHRRPHGRNLHQGTHYIGHLIVQNRETDIYNQQFDLGDNDESFSIVLHEIINTVHDKISELSEGLEDSAAIKHATVHMINELCKNIHSYGGAKGYIVMTYEPHPEDQGTMIHMAVGDYGPGIENTAGSHDNYFKEGFTTTEDPMKSLSGCGIGGRKIKGYAEKLKMDLTLYDNGKSVFISSSTKPHLRKPLGKKIDKGSHFIGSFLIPKK